MRAVSSLTNRIFLACTAVAALSLGFAFAFVNARASREAEEELRRGLLEAGRLVDEHRATLTDTFARLAHLIADLPKLKAAVETGDPPTVQPLASEYAAQMKAAVLVLTSPKGEVLGAVGEPAADLAHAVAAVGATDELSTFLPHGRGLLQIVSVPLVLDGPLPAVLGRLSAGFLLDGALAAQFKRLTASEIAFGVDDRIVASTLPDDRRASAEAGLAARDITPVALGGEDFLVLARPLLAGDEAGPRAGGPGALILRSRTERLRFLNTIRNGLVAALVLTVIVATLASYGVARTMTRPLDTITTAMREMAATGDLTRRVPVKRRAWDDEDARLLAATFNTMTESIARFQKEAAHRERLSSLGRLSTVIAHEIRNPLMIIKASLPSLRRDAATASERREAVADIEEETTRINRIVSEVLDFARPIRFELAEADLNEICRASAAAAWADAAREGVRLDLDDRIPPILTDGERLRTVLVNLLVNARHAVEAVALAGTGTDGGSFRLKPEATGSSSVRLQAEEVLLQTRLSGSRVDVLIRDRGVGIAADDMAHIFDPFFTTRRAGTGLGLPIAKNIVEGLGGTISVTSRVGEGTDIHVDLPLEARA
jgi:signal transduction histidine kinase